MARKRVDLKAVKAAKQKKIAIGGGIVFVLLLFVSVPKTLKMMHPHDSVGTTASATSSSATTTDASTTPSTAAPTTPSVPTSVPVSNTAGTAAVLSATLAPAAREGQLQVLSASFKSKDPFKQLIDPNAQPPSTATTQSTDTAKPTATTPATPGPELKVLPTATPKPATPPTSGPAPVHVTPKAVLPFLSALISVNGAPSHVNLRLNFPAGAPLFQLLELTKKTAKISVVGGTLAGGAPTLTLRRGKPVTLANTADGTRYKLELVSTSTKAVATKKPSQPAATATTPTPTTTTPPTTTTTPSDTLAVPPLGG